MGKWVRIAIVLAAMVITCLVYVVLFGAPTISMLEVRHMASKAPVKDRVPVPLPDLSVSQATGTKLSYFGYSFEIPSNDVDPTRGKTWTNRVVVAFKSGNAMMPTSFPPSDFVNGIATTFHVTPEKLCEGFGDQVQSELCLQDSDLKRDAETDHFSQDVAAVQQHLHAARVQSCHAALAGYRSVFF